ncbi:hypothetical protein CDD83_10162 [Cordyceps sp. RAO-2017]|nr:hypothetical protein CDD83_10162 [Cordyceps sp. RAO-2017]
MSGNMDPGTGMRLPIIPGPCFGSAQHRNYFRARANIRRSINHLTVLGVLQVPPTGVGVAIGHDFILDLPDLPSFHEAFWTKGAEFPAKRAEIAATFRPLRVQGVDAVLNEAQMQSLITALNCCAFAHVAYDRAEAKLQRLRDSGRRDLWTSFDVGAVLYRAHQAFGADLELLESWICVLQDLGPPRGGDDADDAIRWLGPCLCRLFGLKVGIGGEPVDLRAEAARSRGDCGLLLHLADCVDNYAEVFRAAVAAPAGNAAQVLNDTLIIMTRHMLDEAKGVMGKFKEAKPRGGVKADKWRRTLARAEARIWGPGGATTYLLGAFRSLEEFDKADYAIVSEGESEADAQDADYEADESGELDAEDENGAEVESGAEAGHDDEAETEDEDGVDVEDETAENEDDDDEEAEGEDWRGIEGPDETEHDEDDEDMDKNDKTEGGAEEESAAESEVESRHEGGDEEYNDESDSDESDDMEPEEAEDL